MKRQALVVGINRYPVLMEKPTDTPPHLKIPAFDAEAIAQTLKTYGKFRVERLPVYNQDNAWRVAPQQQVKVEDLKTALNQLFNPPRHSIPDTALFFFAGHGLRGVTGSFLATSDSFPVNGDWGLSLDWLRQLLEDSPVRQQIVCLDCCYSGELLNFNSVKPGILETKDRCLIAASREYEVAYEDFSGNHGILSGALLEALNPENHPESHPEGWVTNHSLVQFIEQQLQTARQRPILYNTPGEIILTGHKEKIDRAILMAEVCPYKGLTAFEFNDKDPEYFYGRTALTNLLLKKVRESNFLAVLGPSGIGKSSVVKAGLLHKLKLGQGLGGKEQWIIKIIRPEEHPLKSLARVFGDAVENMGTRGVTGDVKETANPKSNLEKAEELINKGAIGLTELVQATLQAVGAQHEQTESKQDIGNAVPLQTPVSNRLILVVDQFEEVFTLCKDEGERQKFFECLLGALDNPPQLSLEKGENQAQLPSLRTDQRGISSQLTVVITMRADFLGKCSEKAYAGLAQKIQNHLVIVTPMEENELVEAITEPALKVGLQVQPELVKQMLADVKGPGSLPLLQYTLTELWRNRRESIFLTLLEYTRLGKVEGALQKRADEVYDALDPKEEQPAAKRIFIELTELGEGTEYTRRQVFKSNLVASQQSEELVDRVLRKLTDARLVVTSELQARGESKKTVTVVDVAHEALIRYWPKLDSWVNENRVAIRIKRKIEEASEEWESKDKSKDDLLTGSKLAEAKNYPQEYGAFSSLSSLATEFVQKSIQQHNRNKQLRVAGLIFFIAVVMLGAVVSAIFGVKSQRLAREATLRENAATLKNLLPVEPVNALVLAIKTTGASQDQLKEVFPQVQSSLYDAIGVARERYAFRGIHNWFWSVAISPDGKTIVTASADDKAVRLWDLKGNPIGQPFRGHKGEVYSVAFSPDGKYIVGGGDDRTVLLWDLKGNPIGQPFRGHKGKVYSVAFSPSGKYIVSGSDDETVRLWDLKGNPIGKPFEGHEGGVDSVAFSPDGKYIVSGSDDSTVRLWDLQGNPIGQSFRGHEGGVRSVAFSPDGKQIVSGSQDSTVRLWDLQGNPIGQSFRGHEGYVDSVAFSPNGKQIVSGSQDSTVRLWDLKGNLVGEPLKGIYYITSLAITPDGKTIVTVGSHDNTVRLWDLEGNFFGQPFKGHESIVNSVAFSLDGKHIVSGSYDNTVRLWDLKGNSIGKPFKGHEGVVTSVAFSPDGKYIVSGSEDKTVRLWDLKGNPIGKPFKGHEDAINSVAFSPDGKSIVSGSGTIYPNTGDNTVRLWDLKGNPIGTPFEGHKYVVKSVAFSPDGKYIVSGSYDNTVRLWDLKGNLIGTPFKGHEGVVTSVAFSPDGKYIVSGSYDGTVRLWDLKGNLIGTPFKGHEDAVTSVAFSSDGQYIVSGGNDRKVQLWDLKGNPIGSPFKGHEDGVTSVAFSPDGKYIVSGSSDKTLRLWRGGNWQDWLKVGCNRLRLHPVLVQAETEEAKAAGETCQKYDWSKTETAQFLVKQGQARAQEGDVKEAEAKFKQARELDSSLDIPTEAEVRRLAAPGLVTKGEKLVQDGKVKEALAAYTEAQKLDPNLKIAAESWDDLCWFGSLNGHAAEVMFACDKLVALEPEHGSYRYTRGVARALTGNKEGAIEDFEAYNNKLSKNDKAKAQVQRWIDVLRAGQNPFTQEEINRLL